MEFRVLSLIFGKKSRRNRFNPRDHIIRDTRRTQRPVLTLSSRFPLGSDMFPANDPFSYIYSAIKCTRITLGGGVYLDETRTGDGEGPGEEIKGGGYAEGGKRKFLSFLC